MKNRSLVVGGRALGIVAAAALTLLSTGASALGLGRVNVQSVLGETLRAEIEVTSLNAEEASSLHVSLASPDAFKASGVEYNPVLSGATVTLSRRADGRPVLVLASDKLVQEPFIDVIVDFQWSTGRLTRSYTLLIDPPGRNTQAQPGTAPVSPVFSSPAPSPQAATAQPPAPSPVPAPAPAARPPAPAPVAKAPAAPAPRVASSAPAPRSTAAAAEPTGESVKVRPGDTLTSLAASNNKPGVSLDQMLVSLYRNNPQAFVDDNMNRMKTGVTLAVPSAETAKQLSTEEAHQVIQVQSTDFAAYRHRLATGVTTVHTEEDRRQASGKVEAQVRDQKTASAPLPSDKLTLSRGAVKPGSSAQEAKISKETQRQAETARVAELSRNVAELKKLSAGTAPVAVAPSAPAKSALPTLPVAHPPAAAPVPAPAPVAAAKPAPVPPPVPSVPTPAPVAKPVAVVPSAPVVASAPVTGPASAVVAAGLAAASEAASATEPASAPVVASAPVTTASAPVRASAPSRPVASLPQPEPESESFLSSLLEPPYAVPGLAALVVALGGFAFWRKRRAGARKFSGETSFMESKIQPDSFFGASGGQRVDTRDGASQNSASSSLNYSLSQLDAIGDVDPVAEADVYLAYGRDLQAEEILKEAQRSDPDRLAIRTKLLEVYAKRADLKTFEAQARQLHSLTQGHGEDWAKAQELGRQIDPTNPLYQEGAAAVDTQPAGLSALPEATPRATGGHAQPDFASTDLPIDFDHNEPAAAPQPFAARDLSHAEAPHAELPATPAVEELPFEVSDFDLEPAHLDLPPASAPEASSARARLDEAPAAAPSIDFDFGDLSLDLGTSPAGVAEPPTVHEAVGDLPELDLPQVDEGEPMARKIELADEFRRIGDHEGARELLEEVVAKADGALRARAQTMLDALG